MTTVLDVQRFKDEHRRFAVITAYDFLSARILDEAGIPVLLVGDSLGMVMLGHPTTLPVTMGDMLHHAKAVARGSRQALLVGDMPFMSYQASADQAVANAGRFVQEAGMHAVKLEGGGERIAGITRRLTESGVPVMGHLGLTPQSVHAMGGFKVQGKTRAQADRILADALALEDAGAFSLVLEGVPSELARQVTSALHIPTIGIGAGPGTDAQVLVFHDMMGITTGKTPKFVKRYANLAEEVARAAEQYARDVASGTFPAPEHEYSSNGVPKEVASPRPQDATTGQVGSEEVKYGAG